MTRVDFYVLPESAAPADSPVMTACKLCEKAVASGQRVYVNAPDATLAHDFDGALWSFRQGSFIAHERFSGSAPEDPPPPVLVGGVEPPESHHGVILNLGPEVPAFFSRFERVLEIVGGDQAQRDAARARFKFYRDRGYDMKTHNL